jgi:hypothetical protein
MLVPIEDVERRDESLACRLTEVSSVQEQAIV